MFDLEGKMNSGGLYSAMKPVSKKVLFSDIEVGEKFRSTFILVKVDETTSPYPHNSVWGENLNKKKEGQPAFLFKEAEEVRRLRSKESER